MPIPEFVAALRAKIGHDPLWLPGVTAVVHRRHEGRTQVLLVRRADDGRWTPVTGIVDPGEQPATAAAREVLEEAGVVAVAQHLARVNALPPKEYENGDRAQYLDLVFRCAWVSGEPYPADGENTAAAWYHLDELPAMDDDMVQRLRYGLADVPECSFEL